MNKYQRFKEGLKNITPLQQLNAKATGSLWGAIGLSIALIGMVYNLALVNFSIAQLGFSIFVFFLIYMQVTQYLGTKQQIRVIQKVEDEANEMEILNKL